MMRNFNSQNKENLRKVLFSEMPYQRRMPRYMRVIAMALSFVFAYSSFMFFAQDGTNIAGRLDAYAAQGNIKYYQWTRIDANSDFLSELDYQASDQKLDGSGGPESGWHRCLILYGDTGQSYKNYTANEVRYTRVNHIYKMTTHYINYDSDGGYYGEAVSPNDNIPNDSKGFVTARHFNAPYIKYAGSGSDSVNCYMKFVYTDSERYDPNTEGVVYNTSKRLMYHVNLLRTGTATCNYNLCMEAGPGVDTNANVAPYDAWYRSTGDYDRVAKIEFDRTVFGLWRMSHDAVGIDPCWRHEGSRVWASRLVTDLTTPKPWFEVYIGKPIDKPAYNTDTEFTSNDNVLQNTVVFEDTVIGMGVKITIGNGVVARVIGKLDNNGCILVEKGGTLIIENGAVITGDSSFTFNDIGEITGCSCMRIDGGTVIVKENAGMYFPRHPSKGNQAFTEAYIDIKNGGVLYNRGKIVVADEMIIRDGEICTDGEGLTFIGYEVANLQSFNPEMASFVDGRWIAHLEPVPIGNKARLNLRGAEMSGDARNGGKIISESSEPIITGNNPIPFWIECTQVEKNPNRGIMIDNTSYNNTTGDLYFYSDMVTRSLYTPTEY